MGNKKPENINFVFLGTSSFSVDILEDLKEKGFIPKLIITAPDKPAGRKMLLTPPPAKMWAEKNNIPVWQPENLKGDVRQEIISRAECESFDLFIVVSYGIIIPQTVIDIPDKGILNVHPSLLPKLRGASPIESTILQDENPGTTIMKIDAKMDHGPLIAQENVSISDWPPYREELYKVLKEKSGELLTKSIIPWLSGEMEEVAQNHDDATFCGKFTKEDMRIDLTVSPKENLKKIRAFSGIGNAYFVDKDKKGNEIRIKVTRAHIEDNILVIEKVIPAGKNEMLFSEYEKNLKA